MPYCIEAACYRNQRVPEGISHPDAEYRVLLAERLAGFDSAAGPATGQSSYGELEYAACHGDKGYADKGYYAAAAVHDGTCAHENGQRECHAPKVETQVYLGGDPLMETWHKPAYGPCA